MYPKDTIVWAIIDKFDRPKECTIVSIIFNSTETMVIGYVVRYMYRTFEIDNVDVYPTQIDAEIYWAIVIQSEYYKTLNHPDFFLTDDYERANNIASEIISDYIEKSPHILFKYL